MKKHKFIVVLFSLLSVFIVALIYLPLGNKLELVIYDLFIESMAKPADPDIVIVDVDDYSIASAADKTEDGLGRYPWPRTSYSKVMKLINKGKPRAIIVDTNFEGKTAYTKKEYTDEQFIKDLQEIPNTFFLQKITTPGSVFQKKFDSIFQQEAFQQLSEEKQKQYRTFYLSDIYANGPGNLIDKHYYSVKDNTVNNITIQNIISYYEMTKYMDGIYQNARKMAISNSFVDNDNVVRSYQPIYKYNNRYLFSTPLAVADFVKGPDQDVTLDAHSMTFGDKTIALNNKYRFYLNWRKRAIELSNEHSPFTIAKDRSYKYISFLHVFFNKDYNLSADIFKDKIVIIGSTSDILKDNVTVPNQPVFFGVEVIATAIDNLLNDNKFIVKAPWWINIAVTVLLIFLGGFIYKWLSAKSTKLYALILYLIAIVVLYVAFNYYLFSHLYIWVDMILPVLVYLVTFTSLIIVTSLIERDKRSHVESVFSKYVSPQIYQSLISNYNNVSLEADRKQLTILFSDIRGFTPFTEELYAEQVAVYLNQYFNEMVKVILKNNGTIDKFMGDAVMAFFGAPVDDEDHAMNAIKAALEMQEALKKLNEKWVKTGKKQLDIGIGINTGSVLVGNFGSENLMDYTVIGDPVNLASRLESLNKQESTNILISAFTYQQVKDRVKVNIVGPRKVKGKSESVVVYELVGLI